MDAVNMDDLSALVDKGRELQTILRGNPDIIQFLQLMKDTGESMAAMPVKTDTLIRAGEAADVLGVDKGLIYTYVREGVLRPYYTPHSRHMKFWLSEVKQVPQRKVKA